MATTRRTFLKVGWLAAAMLGSALPLARLVARA